MLLLRIRYGGSLERESGKATKSFRFAPETLVGDAVQHVLSSDRTEVKGEPCDWGLFVPTHSGYRCSGWLSENTTLDENGLSASATVELRQKVGREIVVLDAKLENPQPFVWPSDTVAIKRNLIELVRALAPPGERMPVMPPGVNKRVTHMNKNELLLNYPLPSKASLVLGCTTGWVYEPDCSDNDILDNCFLYLLTPALEGEMMHKTKVGLKKVWKRRWVRLLKDTLVVCSLDARDVPLLDVHVQNVLHCHQTEPIDAASQRLGNVIKIGTKKKTVFLGTGSRETMQNWLNKLEVWVRFKDVLRPKAITSRGVALSSLLQEGPRSKRLSSSSVIGVGDISSIALSTASPLGRLKQEGLQEVRSRATSVSSPDALEVQPNRSVSVVCVHAPERREMIVDSRLDVYELAYMIAEEIQSQNAFVMEEEDHGPLRHVELLDHQESLASQNVPLSASFVVKKTGIVDDFVRENDIYDNHFLYVMLPVAESPVLFHTADGWLEAYLVLTGGVLCSLVDPESVSPETTRAVMPMTDVMSVRKSKELARRYPELEDFCVLIETCAGDEYHMVVAEEVMANEWKDLDAWYGFFKPNPVDFSLFLGDNGERPPEELTAGAVPFSSGPYEWLGVDPQEEGGDDDEEDAASPATETLLERPSTPGSDRIKQYEWRHKSAEAPRPRRGSLGDDVDLDEAEPPRLPPVKPLPTPVTRAPEEDKATAKVRRVYECLDPVQLRPLAVDDPSQYLWKVTHSLNGQVLGYATCDSNELVFFDCLENELLRLSRDAMEDLETPKARVEALRSARARAPRADTMARICTCYDVPDDHVVIRKVKDSEFGYRVTLADNTHMGWADRDMGSGMFIFYDRNGNHLVSIPIGEMPNQEPMLSVADKQQLSVAAQLRKIFQQSDAVRLVPTTRTNYSHIALVQNDTHVGWGDKESFDYCFYDLEGVLLKKLPLTTMDFLDEKRATNASKPVIRKTMADFRTLSSGNLRRSGGLIAKKLMLHPRKEEEQRQEAQDDSDDDAYIPDGLSPELKDEGYDEDSKHKPMGIMGLLGEPPSSSEEDN